MAVDVVTSIEIDRPRKEVAAFASDPDNATAWYQNIAEVDWETTPPAEIGSRMAFVARFLGRRLAYTYEVVANEPGQRLVMRTSEGSFPMETTYTWQDTDAGGTLMTLRNSGEPAGFSKLMTPLMGMSVRRANNKDLRALKRLLEA